jgi:radical SAM protein (TIGR01212 family)
MDFPLIRTFSYHYRQKYGYVVGKIPVDMGVPCPNREKGGCIFCSPPSFTPSFLKRSDTVFEQINSGIKKLLKNRFVKYFAYFQQESCTVLPANQLIPVMQSLLLHDDCVGLIVSTRPDCIKEELLDMLAECIVQSGKECLFELGLQTVHAKSLKFLNRNHSLDDFTITAGRIKNIGCFELGAHLIFGIPGETEEMMLTSLQTVCDMGVNALKLHHLQVIKDTPLHVLYEKREVALFSRKEYLAFLLKALPLIPADVTIHRFWSTSHPDYLVAPKWNCLASELSSELRGKMSEKGLRQGLNSAE